jgi:hypothetical protein
MNGINVSDFAIAFAGFVLAGFWREIHLFKRDVGKWQARIDTALFGATGDNGLHGTSKDHETRLRALERHHQAHEERVA